MTAILALVAALFSTSPTPVAGVAFVTLGDTISWIADLPAPPGTATLAPSARGKLGYRFNFLNFLGLDLWTYGGGYCVYDDAGRYRIVSRVEAENLLRPAALPGPPLEYRYPMGLVALVVILGLGTPVALVRRRMLNRPREPTLFGR